MKKLFLQIFGVFTILAACCVPIAGRYAYAAGPEWLRGEDAHVPVVFSCIFAFVATVAAACFSFHTAHEIKDSRPPSQNNTLLCALMLAVGVILGIVATVGYGRLT